MPGFGSLNLSHAVALVCYELWLARCRASPTPASHDRAGGGHAYPPPSRKAVLRLEERLRHELSMRGYRHEVSEDQREHVREVDHAPFHTHTPHTLSSRALILSLALLSLAPFSLHKEQPP